MKANENSGASLPDDLRIVPAARVRKEWGVSEATLWRAEQAGKLSGLRIGRRRYYRVSSLKAFLDEASQAKPISVPWADTVKSSI
jgi:DNA-binding transcriptional regulator PaaX